MASNLRGYSADEVLNKVLNTSNDSIQVDIVAGAEYAEDSEHTSTDTGNFVLGVRNDTLAYLGGADGDYVPFQMNADGALYVEISSGGANDSIYVDDATWTDSTSKHTLVGGLYQSSPQTITDGDVGPFQVDADGALHISDGGNTITVDGTVDLGSTATTHLSEIEGAVETIETTVGTDGSAGPAKTLSVAGTESGGNIQELRVDSDGHLQVDVLSAASTAVTNAGTFAVQSTLAASDGTDIGDVDVASIVPGYGATNLGKREDDPHSNLDTGVMALAVRNDDVAALASADNDYAPLQVNATGSLYTVDETGAAGSILVTGTGAITAAPSNSCFVAIQFLEDTIFDSTDGLIAVTEQLYPDDNGTGTTVSSSNGANTDGVTFPQGMTIFGRWSGFKLTATGAVIAYLGYESA